MSMDVARLLLAQITALGAGGLLFAALGWWRMPTGLLVLSAWLAGTGLLAAQRLLLSQMGLPWSLPLLALPWIAVAGLAGLRNRSLLVGRRIRWPAASWLDLAVALGIAVWSAALMAVAMSTPLTGWDARILWVFKGRVFYELGAAAPGFFVDPAYAYTTFNHMDYPLLVPLNVARIFEWAGDNDVIVKGWWGLLAGAAAAGVYYGLAGLMGRPARLAGLLLVMSLPAMFHHAAAGLVGFAELPLAVFMLYAGVFLYRWWALSLPQDFALSALFFGLCAFTKNEGLAFALAGLAVLAIAGIARRIYRRPEAWLGFGLAALMFVPWEVEKAVVGIRGDLNPSLSAAAQHFGERIGPALAGVGSRMVDSNRVGAVWVLLPVLGVVALLLARRQWLRTAPVLVLLPAYFAAIMLAYLTTPHDLAWHITYSADRLVFQPTLLAIALLVAYVDALLERRASLPEPAAQPA
jgi:hypothetical protein